MAQLFKNNAFSTLASGINDSAVSLTVASGEGARFPTISNATQFYYLTLFRVVGNVEQDHEIVKVTARSTDVFTVLRGQDGTTPGTWSAGEPIELRVTAAVLAQFAQKSTDLEQELFALSHAIAAPVTQYNAAWRADSGGAYVENWAYAMQYRVSVTPLGGSSQIAIRVFSSDRATVEIGGLLSAEPGWDTSTKALHIGAVSSVADRSSSTYLGNNTYFDGTNWKFLATAAASVFQIVGQSGSVRTAASGTAGTNITWTTVLSWDSSSLISTAGSINIPTGKVYQVNSTQVVGARETGWTAATGTPNKGSFATGSATTQNCAERIKAIEDALRTHGLIN